MNKTQLKGVAQKVKGKVNASVGRATGNPARELKGIVQKGLGGIQKAVGDEKERMKRRGR
ncbi:MAG TPA: CsbD family protein [Trinickia sp.]|nr:CsbD family protein [Trinickia sp.]